MVKDGRSLAQRTADEIYDMIFKKRRFPSGGKLPNENELSAELGISRATLREAIRILAAHQVLEIRRRGFWRYAGARGPSSRESPPCLTITASAVWSTSESA